MDTRFMHTRLKATALAGILGSALCAGAALAQQTGNAAQPQGQSGNQASGAPSDVDVVQLTAWDVEPLYQGYRAEQLLDT
jgi:hypothetical protein